MNDVTEVSVAELDGAALDWAVAKALGATFRIETFIYQDQYGTTESDTGDYARADGLGYHGSLWAAISLDRHAIHPAWRSTSDRIWRPSTDWAQGGPLIERYRVAVVNATDRTPWIAMCMNTKWTEGATPLIATMRAIVAAELGDTVQVPASLVR